jgi:Uma2 family endonuclease
MSSQPKTLLTPEEYLAIERESEVRHEYHAGEMFAMVGASRKHNLIVTSLTRRIDEQLDGKPCELYGTDMRVRIPATGLYTYPDVVVVCGEPQFEDEQVDTLLNPIVIIEVLSPSTEAYDRGKKFVHYQQTPSLIEYLLVAQESCRVEQFVRQGAAQWLYSAAHQLEDTIKLSSISCALMLKDIYARVV